MRVAVIGLVAALVMPGAASAQVLYPIDRAEILAGSRFDLKVEFPAVADPARVRVTINGQDHAATLGRAAEFIGAGGRQGRVRLGAARRQHRASPALTP